MACQSLDPRLVSVMSKVCQTQWVAIGFSDDHYLYQKFVRHNEDITISKLHYVATSFLDLIL